MSASERNDPRRMAILMRYEQLGGRFGGLVSVGYEFDTSPEAVREIVKKEQSIATSGERKEIRKVLNSLKTRRRV